MRASVFCTVTCVNSLKCHLRSFDGGVASRGEPQAQLGDDGLVAR